MTSFSRLLTLASAVFFAAHPAYAAPKQTLPDPLEHLKATIASYPEPGLWDAAVFFPTPAMRPFWASLKEKQIFGGKTFGITVVDVDMATGWGEARAKVKLRLAGPAGAGSTEVVVNAQLLFDGFEADDVGSGRALFHVAIDASAAATTGAPASLLAQLTNASAFAALNKNLTFSIPVPLEFSQKFGFDEDLVVRAGTEGWVQLHANVPETEFRLKVDTLEPIFVPSGVWLCARFVKSPIPVANQPPSAPSLNAALRPYEQQSSKSPKLLANGNFLAGFVNDFSNLPDARRTATVKVTKTGGRLLKTGGDAYVAVWLQNAEKATGALTVNPKAQWSGDGLKIASGYHAKANADFHIHADPGPTGGFGTSIGTIANSDGDPVKATLVLDQMKDGDASVAFLRPKIQPGQEVTAILRTNGRAEIKFAGGWFNCSVPSLGVKVSLPVPPDLIPRIALLSNSCIPLAPVANSSPLSAVITPRRAGATAHGYSITFDAAIVSLSPKECAVREQQIAAMMHSSKTPNLTVGRVEVLIGDWAIGKNNTLVKFVVEVVKAADNIKRTGEIAVKDTGRELTIARKNVGRETTKTWQGIRREGGAFVREVHSAVKVTGEVAHKAEGWIEHHVIPHPHFDTPFGRIKL